jgi:hypothetical protein
MAASHEHVPRPKRSSAQAMRTAISGFNLRYDQRVILARIKVMFL